jgi:uncharacterized protein YbaP (TraB family)
MMNKLQLLRTLLGAFFVCFVITFLGACSESATSPDLSGPWGEKHFLWKVSDENSSVWLLGSIHVADESFYPLPTVIDSAFAASSELAVEIDITDGYIARELRSEMESRGMLATGTLRDVLPPELWYSLDSLCTAWDLPVKMFERMRPWLAATELSSYAYMREGLKSEYGIDYVLLNRATTSGKPIISLESVKGHIDAVADPAESDSAGICYLKSTLHEVSMVKMVMNDMVRAWKTGDDELLTRLLDEENDVDYTPDEKRFMDEYNQRLMTNRNVLMADSVEMFLHQDRNVFVVVGAAHLAYEQDNVIASLARRGFIVERF